MYLSYKLFKNVWWAQVLLLLLIINPSLQQVMKCAYGERGSLTATCVNATASFFRQTSYRFDSLDETLRCVNCNLDTIESNNFDISGNVFSTLDLKNSKISTLKEMSFVGLVFLKNLWLDNNQIKNMFPGVFKGVKKLENLQLVNNSIAIVVGNGFKELENLRILNLENNKIKTIDELAFNGTVALEELNLAHNQIYEVSKIFDILPKIKIIDLSYNNINILKQGHLTNLSTLLTLNLAYNKITTLDPKIFSSLHNLNILNLSSNSIKTMSPGCFEGLKKLDTLDLANNQLVIIEKRTFLGLYELRELTLANNLITYFKTGLYSGLPELRYLNISHNKIGYFQKTGIAFLQNVHTLDLSYNNLTDLDYKMLYTHMPKITYMGLENNRWPCYLIKEMDDYFEHDNIKLSADSILRNNSCIKLTREETKAIVSEELSSNDLEPSYARAYVVYPLIFAVIFINLSLFYILYRMDKYSRYYSGSYKTTSQANLATNDFQPQENDY